MWFVSNNLLLIDNNNNRIIFYIVIESYFKILNILAPTFKLFCSNYFKAKIIRTWLALHMKLESTKTSSSATALSVLPPNMPSNLCVNKNSNTASLKPPPNDQQPNKTKSPQIQA